MTTPDERLKLARINAGFHSARSACEALGWTYPSYGHHENGTRGFNFGHAEKYGRAFKVDPVWLLTGKNKPKWLDEKKYGEAPIYHKHKIFTINVPVISYSELIGLIGGQIQLGHLMDESREHIVVEKKSGFSGRFVALKATDDANEPGIQKGDLVVLDLDLDIPYGNYAALILQEYDEYLIGMMTRGQKGGKPVDILHFSNASYVDICLDEITELKRLPVIGIFKYTYKP